MIMGMMKFMLLLCSLFILLLVNNIGVEGRRIQQTRFEYGDAINCVDIYKQPAFDLPWIKNHSIQMKPSWSSDEKQTGLLTITECPEGTVPIRKIVKVEEEQMTAYEQQSNIAFALAGIKTKDAPSGSDVITGAEASLQICKPSPISAGESSSGFIKVVNGDNEISAGWIVDPSLHGDDQVRLYMAWKSGKDGCKGVTCKGFIQTNKNVVLKSPVGNLAELSINIRLDESTGNWWLNINSANIGYWPMNLFSNLKYGTQSQFGGTIDNSDGGSFPKMGNGELPEEGKTNACHVKDLKIRDSFGNVAPVTETFISKNKPSCYSAIIDHPMPEEQWGLTVFFGGPGGRC